ncbi:hypothetical protein BN946_scf184982.g7 [Trametes cinnabarina]|uniref:Uncharacterized protein n=1 Tax=Pycnoporus cinnabarinus TaxID=5643 RepID=A0A060SVN4_PYCCI|nr:hypothetical protein BN946_scf184982.g7 [Trametes cinnabarina]
MEELDLYLPSYPYQDNPVLHVYAGLIALYLAQPGGDNSEEMIHDHRWDTNLVRDAHAHFERARTIDPSNIVAEIFLAQLPGLAQGARVQNTPDSDDEKMEVDDAMQARKRVKA